MVLSEGQMSDHKGARLVLDALPPARCLIADRGYDSAWFREALASRAAFPPPMTTTSGMDGGRHAMGSAATFRPASQPNVKAGPSVIPGPG